MLRVGIVCLLGLTACRDRGQDVPGGSWVGTAIDQRARFQAEREAARAAQPVAPATEAAPTTEAVRPAAAPAIALPVDDALDEATEVAGDPTTASLLAEARRHLAANRLDDARGAVARAKLRDPEGPAVLLLDGRLLALGGEHRAALRAYELALRSRPDDAELLYLKAVAHLALNERSAAAQIARRLAAMRPEDAKIRRLVARAAPQDERLAASAQAAATGDPAAIREHADNLLDAGRAEEAVDFFALAAAQRRDDADLHLRWGLALAALGRQADADAPLVRATELDPRRTTAWHSLATAREQRGDVAGAIAAWQGLLDHTTPGDAEPIRRQIERLRTSPTPNGARE